jgi:glycosyltransferase involved in cell wall biosynthesis
VGLLQIERGLLEILEVMKRHPDWCLSLGGFGGDEALILERSSGMENVKWHGRVSYEQALELYYQADVLYATYDPAITNHRFTSPNKVFEGMMLGKPTIVARRTGIDRTIEEHHCGMVVDYGDVEDLDRVLTDLYDNPTLRDRLGRNGRQAYVTRFSWTEMETRLNQFYSEIQA